MPWFSQISRLFDFEKGSRETEGSMSLWKSVKTSSLRFFIRKWSSNVCHFHDYLTSQSRTIPSQSQKMGTSNFYSNIKFWGSQEENAQKSDEKISISGQKVQFVKYVRQVGNWAQERRMDSISLAGTLAGESSPAKWNSTATLYGTSTVECRFV